MKYLSKQVTAIILVLALMVSTIDVTAFAGINNGPVIYENQSYDTIGEALKSYESDGVIHLTNGESDLKKVQLTITDSIQMNEQIVISDNVELNIVGRCENESKLNVKVESDIHIFQVEKNAGLKIHNIEFDGTDVQERKKEVVINNGNVTLANVGFVKFSFYRTPSEPKNASVFKMSDAVLNMDSKCILADNKASGVNATSAAINASGSCHISGGTIRNNSATYYGGAIYVKEDIKEFVIENVKFESNSADWGGAVYVSDKQWGGTVVLNECEFDTNKSWWGDAVYLDKIENVQIYNCIFNKNEFDLNADSGTVHVENWNKGEQRTDIKMGGVSFSENQSRNGAVYLYKNVQLTLLRKGIYEVDLDSYTKTIQTKENVFTNNKSTTEATAINIDNMSSAVVEEATFDSNKSLTNDVYEDWSSKTTKLYGNAPIYNQGKVDLYDVDFSGNTTPFNDGSVNRTVACVEQGEMYLYRNANLRGEIVLGNENVIQVEEELIYHTNASTPLDVRYISEIPQDAVVAQYNSKDGCHEAYDDANEEVWNICSYIYDNWKAGKSSLNHIKTDVITYSQKIKCNNTDKEVVSGISFHVYMKTAENKYIFLTQTKASDDNGEVLIKNLAPGNYTLVEKSAPEEYKLSDEKIDFSITDKDGTIINFNAGRYNYAPVAVIDVAEEKEYSVGNEVNFSASNSTDDTGIEEYEWDFGDGSGGIGETISHKYVDGGTYNVTLTVTDEDGTSTTEVKTITVKDDTEHYCKLKLNIKSSDTGEALKNTRVQIWDEKSKLYADKTVSDGVLKVSLLKEQKYKIVVCKNGYEIRATTVNLSKDGNMNIFLLSSETIIGELKVSEMSYDEIVEAGIDVDSDENNNVYKYSTHLSFMGSDNLEELLLYRAGYRWINRKYRDNTIITGGQDEYAFIIVIDGTTKWLKDMFHVQLFVYNTSTKEYVKDCSAELLLPEGLSLAKMEKGISNDAVKNIGQIGSKSQASAEWYVRGDEVGIYNISAKLTGEIETKSENQGSVNTDNTNFEYYFVCNDSIIVSSPEALQLDIYVADLTAMGQCTNLEYVYTNVSSKPLYGLQFCFDDERQTFGGEEITDYYYNHVTVSGEKDGQVYYEDEIGDAKYYTCKQLDPGDSFTIKYDTLNIGRGNLGKDIYELLVGVWQSVLPGSTANIPTCFHVIFTPVEEKNFADTKYPEKSTYSGDPVNLLTGEFYYDYTDITVLGKHELNLDRHYSSSIKEDVGFGTGWVTNYSYKLVELEENIIAIKNPTRTNYNFIKDDDGIYHTSSMNTMTVSKTDDGYVFIDDQTKYSFDKSGNLIKIVEEDGWETILTYDNSRVKTISSNAGTILFTTDENGHYITVAVNGKVTRYSYEDNNLTSVTNMDNDTMRYSYDGKSNIVTITDFEGITTIENVYDSHARVTNQELSDEGTFEYFYDDENRVCICKGENGYVHKLEYNEEYQIISDIEEYETKYKYDKFGMISSKEDSDGITYYSYDAKRNLQALCYPDKTVEVYRYDKNDRIISYKNRRGGTEDYSYDTAGNVISRRDVAKNIITYCYDENRNMISETTGEGYETKYSYNQAGLVVTKTDANGNVTYYNYDDFGRVIKETDHSGNTKEYSYSDAGKLLSQTDEKGNVIEYSVNKNGFNTSITDKRGNISKMEYNTQSKTSKEISRGGYVTTYGYDKAGNVVSETNNNGETVLYTYDANGNIIEKVDAKGNVWKYSYDEKGRVSAEIDSDGNSDRYTYDSDGKIIEKIDKNGNKYTYEYDNGGNVISEIDQLGNRISYKYDRKGHLVEQIDRNNNVTSYEYNKENRLTSITTDKGTTTYTYDGNGNVLSVKKPDNGITTYTYDYANRVSSITNPKGYTTTYTYDGVGNLVTQTNPEGKEISYVYDADGNVTSIYDEKGYREYYWYDSEDRVIRYVNRLRKATTYTYDCNNNVVSETDSENRVTNRTYDKNGLLTGEKVGNIITGYEYDAFGRVVKEKVGSSEETVVVKTYEYDKVGNITSTTDGNGNKTTYQYDTKGQVISSTDGNGNTTEYEYDGNGNVIKRVDASGKETTFEYDSMNNVVSQADSTGVVYQWEYDSNGNVTSYTDEKGNITKYIYDANGNNTEIVDAHGVSAEMVYDKLDRVTSISKNNVQIEGYTYDEVGNVATYTDGNGNITSYGYDRENRKTSSVIGAQRTRYVYDTVGRTKEIVYADGASEGYTYDENDNVISYTDKNGNITKYTYDIQGNLTSVKEASGDITTYTYDNNKNIKTVVQYRDSDNESTKEVTSYVYDGNNNCIKKTKADGTVIVYEYDCMNNLIAEKDGDGNVKITYEYDLNNHLIKKTDGREVITYECEADGDITKVVTAKNTVTYDRDSLDRIIRINSSNTGSISYGYDSNGNKTCITNSDGKTVNYEYDGIGNITKITNDNNVVNYEYDQYGNVLSKTINGKTESYKYDVSNRLLETYSMQNGESKLLDQYAYDFEGNITSHIETGLETGKYKKADYTYDVNNRLSSHEVTKGDETVKSEYTYDGVGNLIKEVSGDDNIVYEYDNNNQLQRKYNASDMNSQIYRSGYSYTYDKNGNLTSIYDCSKMLCTEKMAYNMDNQIVSKTTNTNVGEASKTDQVYEYDGLGNLIAVTQNSLTVSDSKTTKVKYEYDLTEDIPSVISETIEKSDNQKITVGYIHGYNNEKVVANVSTLNGNINETYALETDYLGSTRLAYDREGNIAASTEYGIWGNILENNQLNLNNNDEGINLTASYTGYIYDEISEWWNAGARTYAPEIKRFVSEDPLPGNIAEPERIIKYTYAGNNPIINVDRDGRSFWSSLGDGLSNIGSGIASCASSAASAIGSGVSSAASAIGSGLSSAASAIGSGLSSCWSSIKETASTVYSYASDALSTFRKTVCTYAPVIWNAANNLMDKINSIPTWAKLAIGTAGAIAGVAFGLPVTTVAGALAGGVLVGGAVSTAAYAVCNWNNFSWDDAGSAFTSGAIDGYMWGGVGSAVAGVKSYASTVKVSRNVYSESAGYKGGSKAVSSPYDLQATHSQTLSKKDMNKLIEDIKSNGINETIKYVEHNGQKYVVDGHHRLIASKRLGLKEISVEKVELPYAGYKTIEDLLWFD